MENSIAFGRGSAECGRCPSLALRRQPGAFAFLQVALLRNPAQQYERLRTVLDDTFQRSGHFSDVTWFTRTQFEAWAPHGIILELRELNYEFGNTIASAINAGRSEDSREWLIPTRIVTSGESRAAMTSLLEYMRQDPKALLCDTIEDAYSTLKMLYEREMSA